MRRSLRRARVPPAMAWLTLACGAGMLLLLHYKYSSARVPPAPPTHAAHKIAAQVVLNRKEAAKAEKGRIIESAHKLAKATDLNTHEIVDKMNQPADEHQKLAEKREALHHKDKHAFHERKRKRDDASARTGEELTWLPKEPVLHQEVHYREGPRNPHGHEATALPPPVQTPWPQELTIANDKVSFTVKVESSNIGTQKMLHYRSAGNLHLTSSEVGQEKVHLHPSLLLMTFQENLRLDSNDCTITTLAAQVDTYPRSIAAELRCNVVAVEASAGARFHETVKETNHVVTVWWSGSIARKDAPYVQLKTKWMLNNNLAAGSLATKLIPEHAIFLSLTSANIKHKGTAMGTPFSHDKKLMWFAIEHPLAVNGILQSDPDKAVCAVVYLAELEPGIPSQQVSVVIGVSHHKVQLRRSFLGYLAETRAAPSRPFTHYNSWFDFASWQEPNATFHYRIMNEAICLDRIHQFGEELVNQRGVKMDSFLWDDGWDNASSLWNFNASSFPRGFDTINVAASSYDIGTGVWLSPWGGYGSAKDARVAAAQREGYKVTMTDAGYGFSLNDPKYAERFKEIMHSMVLRYGVNMFKVDGIGFDGEHHHIAKEMDGMLNLLKELRAESTTPLWLSLTTGTWPSPFWLQHGDSIWRGHGDLGLEGSGTHRMRWLRYRDAVVYHLVVAKSPWMPLAGLMLHGIVLGAVGQSRHAGLDHIADIGDFEQEVWTYFGMGVNLQELYLSPDRMSSEAWDIVAKAAKWARSNHEMLQDSHWVGGDPLKSTVAYGFGSFHPAMDNGKPKFSMLMRNPNAKSVSVKVDLMGTLELPAAMVGTKWQLEEVYSPVPIANVFKGLNCADKLPCSVQSNAAFSWEIPGMSAILINAQPV